MLKRQLITLLCCFAAVGCSADEVVLPDDPDDHGVSKVKEEAYPDGAVRTVLRRRKSDGLLLSRWQYSTDGTLIRCDSYDSNGHLIDTLFRWPDGSALQWWFDKQHRVYKEYRMLPDPRSKLPELNDIRVHLLRGSVTLRPPRPWPAHELNDYRDVVTCNLVDGTNACLVATAYDLTQSTNRAAYSQQLAAVQYSQYGVTPAANWIVLVSRGTNASGEIRDCFLTNTPSVGIHIKLTVADSVLRDEKRKADLNWNFETFLKTVEVREMK